MPGRSSIWEEMLRSSASASVWLSIQRDPASSATTVWGGKSHLCLNVLFYGSAARIPHVQGAFSERFVAVEQQCFPIPDSLSYRAAACAEPLAVALHTVTRAGDVLGRRVLVTGCGPIGVLAVAAARLAGAGEIVVTDVFDQPLQIAKRMGATHVVNVASSHRKSRSSQRMGGGSTWQSRRLAMFALWEIALTPQSAAAGLCKLGICPLVTRASP